LDQLNQGSLSCDGTLDASQLAARCAAIVSLKVRYFIQGMAKGAKAFLFVIEGNQI